MRVGVFGLGEAGSEISRDLAAAGAAVVAYDPADVETPLGVERVAEPRAAVGDAELVMAVTASVDASSALQQALDTIPSGVVYADLSTASPGKKRELSERTASAGLRFADVALMSTVPGTGLGTPTLTSGPGADAYAELVGPLGAVVEAIGPEPGAAATRKLLRSIVIKGLAAVLIESLRAAHEAGLAAETWQNVVGQLADADPGFIGRLVDGTGPHAKRRRDEMAAAVDLLDELGVASAMTRATVENLDAVLRDGLPQLPH